MNTFDPYPTPSDISTSAGSTLVRFVTDGLLATIDCYRAGSLPLHRFAWELRTRIDSLAELDPPARTLTRLRWLQRNVELLHDDLSADEQNILTVTLRTLTLVLATLTPPGPLDPSGAARPSAVEPVTIPHARPTSRLRLVA
jgi:hypothetical protein